MLLQLTNHIYYCKPPSVKEILFAKVELRNDADREEEKKKKKVTEESQEKANTEFVYRKDIERCIDMTMKFLLYNYVG